MEREPLLGGQHVALDPVGQVVEDAMHVCNDQISPYISILATSSKSPATCRRTYTA